MKRIYTIGFTQKTAQEFFELLKNNHVEHVIDIRLNNTSQLAAFAKYPDIKYFLKAICNIEYVHDLDLAPTENIMKEYKNKKIDWQQYEKEFDTLLKQRNIDSYIKEKYSSMNHVCLLCSEATADRCHRQLIAKKFADLFEDVTIKHL
jgi:uncharacterized protein (DUF488 family)